MAVNEHSPILVILIPFFFSIFIGLIGIFRDSRCYVNFIAGLGLTLAMSVYNLIRVVASGELTYNLGGWESPIGIELTVDTFNGTVLVFISLAALLTAVHSSSVIHDEIGEKLPQFCSMYLLFVVGLLGMTITGDLFNLYVFLEITALTSYCLIALGGGRAYMASFHYLVLGTIGACFYLIGVGYLYIMTGSLNMDDVSSLIPGIITSRAVLVGFIFILLGVWIKMALFPLHTWLPNAYHYAPNTVSCLIGPLSTKVSVLIMIRIMFSVFTGEYVFSLLNWSTFVVSLASIGIIAGSVYALAQNELKRIFSYLIVAEVGYMVGGVWLANRNGILGAGFHILADVSMTLCLFKVASIVILRMGGQTFDHLKGVFGKMPYTMGAFLVVACSMIGVPPTCGFFSKWYLILGAFDASHWLFAGALIFSSLVNAVLFFRIIEYGYFKSNDDAHDDHQQTRIAEAPLSMLVPLYCVAAMIIAVGLLSSRIIEHLILPGLPI